MNPADPDDPIIVAGADFDQAPVLGHLLKLASRVLYSIWIWNTSVRWRTRNCRRYWAYDTHRVFWAIKHNRIQHIDLYILLPAILLQHTVSWALLMVRTSIEAGQVGFICLHYCFMAVVSLLVLAYRRLTRGNDRITFDLVFFPLFLLVGTLTLAAPPGNRIVHQLDVYRIILAVQIQQLNLYLFTALLDALIGWFYWVYYRYESVHLIFHKRQRKHLKRLG